MTGSRVAAVGLLGLALWVLAWTVGFPAGMHGVPGPGLMPRLLGGALALVALQLLRTPTPSPGPIRQQREIALTCLLLVVYAALWTVVPFGALTAAILLAFLRMTGASWRGAVLLAGMAGVLLHVVLVQVLAVRF
jgi:hypothetical protein